MPKEQPIISITNVGDKVWFFYQSGTRMQDIILIQLGFKTSAHTMQLHSHATTWKTNACMASIVGQQGKFGQHFP
jgi:hypothetical protein